MNEVELLNIEFYQEPSGEVIVRRERGDRFILNQSQRDFIVPMKVLLQSDYAAAYKGCEDMNSKSRINKTFFDFLNVRQFLKCNFNQYDNVFDIDASGNFHFEYINCPLRGTCKYENIICNPKFTNRLTDSDITIIRMIVNQKMTADQIALALCRSINTINTRRKIILKKTGCKNIAQLVAYCYEHKII
jgi:DNA-binding CsgD family transcriptional regulator